MQQSESGRSYPCLFFLAAALRYAARTSEVGEGKPGERTIFSSRFGRRKPQRGSRPNVCTLRLATSSKTGSLDVNFARIENISAAPALDRVSNGTACAVLEVSDFMLVTCVCVCCGALFRPAVASFDSNSSSIQVLYTGISNLFSRLAFARSLSLSLCFSIYMPAVRCLLAAAAAATAVAQILEYTTAREATGSPPRHTLYVSKGTTVAWKAAAPNDPKNVATHTGSL